MTVGLNPVIVNQLLDSLFSAAAFTPPAASYVQLHTGDPGVNGTANISSFATRTLISVWGSAAGGTKSITASVTITASWAGTNGETLTHVSYWSAVTGGTFVTSDLLLQSVVMATGAPLSLPSLSAPFTPLAA